MENQKKEIHKLPNISKVSVIIPVYNVENHLEDCLDSVINQTLRDIEIICIDDGSTDGSLDILEKFAQKDDRIKIISQENQGAGAARNKGLKIAQGEYLSFLDADDFFELDMLEKVYEYSTEKSLEIAIYGVKTFNDKTSEVKEIEYDIQRKYLPNKFIFNYKDFPMYVFNTFKNWTWNKLFKRIFILKNDIEFQELFRTNDLLFTCKALVKAERISVLDTSLVYYRVGHDFHSQNTNHEHPLDFYNAMIALKSFLIDENIFHEVEQSFVNFAASGCLYNLKSLNTKESHEKLYNFLHDEGLEQLSISGKPDDYFYDRNLLKIKEIEKHPMLKPLSKPRVSIIIPIYNVETYLEECLDSIVNQTLRDIEIICIDDGSTDGSLSILEEYEKKDDRIRIISKPNSGYGHTMNVGIDAATGEYIGIVEPDDYVALDMYEILYNEAVKNDLDLIKADFYRFTETGENIKKTYEKVAREDSNYNRVINPQNELQVFRFIMNTWTGIYKKDFIEKYNIRHNETSGASFQDNGFWFQTLAFATRTYFLNKPFYMNRRDNQDSSVHDKGKVFAMCEEHDFMRDILDNNPKLKENPEFKEELIYVYQRKRFNSYVFTLNRIGPEFYKMFLEKFHEDYVQAADNNELKEELFYEEEWDFLQRVIKDPASVKESDFKIFSDRSSFKGLIYEERKLDKLLSFLYILKKERLNPKNIYRIYKARGQIKSLNLFDEGYYLNNYPDVKKSNINPLDHYLCIGWMEKRTPSKKFNGNYYLRKYSDVKRSNFNPLVHYVRHGKREGRFPSHQAEINSPQNKIKKLERKINQQNRKINTLKREMRKEVKYLKRELRKYTRVYTLRHINKEKIACEIELFKGLGVTEEKRSPQIIVSLTSYPDRIYDIHYCLYSLLNQSFKPDKLILWLSKEEFPNLEEDLPSNVLNLRKHGLEIKWTEENFRVYNKLIHSLKEYPHDVIVTADDDIFYQEDWLERLYENYDGKNVIAHRAHLISLESGSPKPYRYWEKSIENDEITILNFQTGVGGVLYPPNVFYKDILKDELFLKLSPTNDEIWFWGMLVLNDRKVKVIKNGYKYLYYINPERELNLNDDGTLFKENALSGQRNDKQFSALLEYYPEIKDKLFEEIPPEVSVIIPVYNREKYLKQCLNSVINQTLKNIEIICIDDGSTDQSLEILNEFAKKDQRIKIINQKNQGVGLARNIGLKIARGEYVGFVDSDDWIDLNFYETLFTEAKKQDADLARTLYVYEFQEHSKEGDTNKIIFEKKSNGELLKVNEHSVVIWNAIYKREYLQKNNIYFDNLRGVVDVPFTAKATYYSKKTIPVIGTYYHYRKGVGNRLTIFNKKRIEELLKANKITLDFINSVKYENKTDYLVAYKRVIWRYDESFGRILKTGSFDKEDQESCFNEIVQGFQSCKYSEDLEKDYCETYFEFLKKGSFNDYINHQLQKN
jgi:glycosyltransferase involved in cell wall biosynthesis